MSCRKMARAVFRVTVSGLLLAACNTDTSGLESEANPITDDTPSASGGGSQGIGGGLIGIDPLGGGGPAGETCAEVSAEATTRVRPMDIILIVDNSGSMTNEIESIQSNINVNFANIIENAGVDYRVILLARHGEAILDQSICIGPPLSSSSCSPAPKTPGLNPGKFYQYNTEVSSLDSLCVAIDGFTAPAALAPDGWSAWLRPDSVKVFVEITDDEAMCSTGSFDGGTKKAPKPPHLVAEQFDNLLLSLPGSPFGSPGNRNYVWHSIVGVEANAAGTPYAPADPLVTSECPSAVRSGAGYQHLSMLTGGLRFPVCSVESYDAVFQEIAKGVVDGAQIACEFDIPTPESGEQVDLDKISLHYAPGDGSASSTFGKVDGAEQCAEDSFYIDGNVIHLCETACELVHGDDSARIDILFGCLADIE